jgi:uncharacterized protein YxeA
MKRILMAIMAVAVAVTFSAPSFAEEKKDEKKGGQVLVYGDEKTEKKDEKKGGYTGTFEEKKDEKKKDEKGK